MSRKAITESTSAAFKTFAVKVPAATHLALGQKCSAEGCSLQDCGLQLIDLYLQDRVELKIKLAVDRQIAAELEQVLKDPAKTAELLKAIRTNTKKGS